MIRWSVIVAVVALALPVRAGAPDPEDPATWYRRGLAADDAGEVRKARAAYEKTLELYPEHGRALINLGILEIRVRRYEEGLARCKAALDLSDDDDNPANAAKAHYCLGLGAAKQGQAEPAAASLTRALALMPAVPEANLELGHIRRSQRRYEEAVELYRQAVRGRPDDADLHVHLGYCYKSLGEWAAAEIEYRKAIQKDPKSYFGHLNLGVVLVRQRRDDEAAAVYVAASKIRPQAAEPHYNLGNLALRRLDLEGALAEYEAAVHHAPDEASYRLAHAKVQWQLGKPELAKASLQIARSLGPKTTVAAAIERLLAQIAESPVPPKRIKPLTSGARTPKPRQPTGRNQPN